MKKGKSSSPFYPVGILALLGSLILGGCIYEVPVTANPTRKVDPRLMGDWVSDDGKDKFIVRQLDQSTYLVWNNGDLFRAYHSDLGRQPFVSVQHLGLDNRKYAYLTWSLSGDGKNLRLRAVKTEVVPDTIKSSADARTLLEKNRQNPRLLGEELSLTKAK